MIRSNSRYVVYAYKEFNTKYRTIIIGGGRLFVVILFCFVFSSRRKKRKTAEYVVFFLTVKLESLPFIRIPIHLTLPVSLEPED